jgi:hypothetical protein
MRARLLTFVSAMATLVAIVSLAPTDVAGQAAAPVRKAAAPGGIPRMPDGKPDLQGTYDIGTLTPLQRTAGTPLVMTAEAAKKLEQQVAARSNNLNAPIAADRAAPPSGGDGSPGPYGNVGGYNNFWLDPGTRYTTVDGQKRASLLIDPPDGRLPALTPEAQQRPTRGGYNSRPTSDQAAREDDPGFEGTEAYNDPEIRPLAERCLIGFSSTSGPPMLPTYFYNNLHQIVQTPDRIMILTEMVHDARIVRIGGTHVPKTIKKWLGDSVGHWEGDTLVVETTNFTDNTRFMGSTDTLRVVERFTRVDARTLRYQFTVEDPKTWTRPWTAEYTWPLTNDLMYEYACHEGNYAMGNILRGARLKEKNDATKSRQ